ncbi:uncharacterized protein BKA78DRAFT_300788 [Phyllosticta capitalensis]|uniref:uncharacterized protein n=1 Tax=Phyllosticta capitalensis TaxID=121624 RepID=UPI0031323FC2
MDCRSRRSSLNCFGTAAANLLEASPFMTAVVPLIPLPEDSSESLDSAIATELEMMMALPATADRPTRLSQQQILTRQFWDGRGQPRGQSIHGCGRPTYCAAGSSRGYQLVLLFVQDTSPSFDTFQRDGRDQSAQGQSIHGLGRPRVRFRVHCPEPIVTGPANRVCFRVQTEWGRRELLRRTPGS